MAAAACSMELGDAPTARDAVHHHSRADEVGLIAAEAAGHADNVDGPATSCHRRALRRAVDVGCLSGLQLPGNGSVLAAFTKGNKARNDAGAVRATGISGKVELGTR